MHGDPERTWMMRERRSEISQEQVADFCRRWQRELALFGSVLRDDFGPESDLDVLVTFAPGAEWNRKATGAQDQFPTLTAIHVHI